MPRAMWSGTISFSLVTIPVKMYAAARSQDVRFNQLHESDMSRIRLQKLCVAEEVPVEQDEIVRGYETSPGHYVVITEEDLEAVRPQATDGIEIAEFVDLVDIDPVYFESSYYLVPGKGGTRAYALFIRALEDSGKIALGRVVLRSKQYLVAIRPAGHALSMATLYYPDEVVAQSDLDGLPAEESKVNEAELATARQLIEMLSHDFEPEQYRDEYRERLLDIIERKAAGEAIEAPPRPAREEKVTDIMAALQASLAAARGKAEAEPEAEPAPEQRPARARKSA